MLKVTILLLVFRLALSMAQAADVPKTDLMQGDGRVSSFYTWAGPIPEMPGTMLRQATLENTLGLSNAAAQFRILYSSTDGIDGHTPTAVSGLFFVPKGEPPNGGWHLLAWAHETAGMADICAPSWTGYSVEIEAFLNAWLTRGFAVVATDYQGLGTPGPHPYMAVRPAAYDVLDSIRAVERSFAGLSGKVLLAGYSQGAGAVFGAAALQSAYASNIDIIGTITTGIPYSPQATAAARDSTATQVSSTLIYRPVHRIAGATDGPNAEAVRHVHDEGAPTVRTDATNLRMATYSGSFNLRCNAGRGRQVRVSESA